MSSILKALKKVETSGHPKKGVGAFPYRPESAMAPRKQVNFSWTLNLAILVVCVGIVLLVLGRSSLFQRPAGDVRFPSDSAAPALDIELIKPLKNKIEELHKPPETRESKAVDHVGPSATSPSPAARLATLSPKPESTPVQERPTPPEAKTSDVQTATAPRETASVRYLDTSSFRLEGVVVVESSNTKYAIINDSIVREGGRVQGHKVIRIRRDYVDLQGPDGSSLFRLEAP